MGSGKSTVGHLLRQMGFAVLDADQVARKVLSPGSAAESEVFKTFGQQLKDAHGHLDRRALGRLVFGDPDRLEKLEGLIHPHVRAEVSSERARLAAAGHQVAFYDVPLLFEKNMRDQFDHVLVISTDKNLRDQRLKVRSQLSEEEIEERTSRHLPAALKEAAASAVICNSGSVEDLNREVRQVLLKLSIRLPPST